MKKFLSVPTEQEQIQIQNEYGSIVGFLISYKWLLQLISFITALSSVFFLLIPFIDFIFGNAAFYVCLATSILIAFTIELFLFKITPKVLKGLFSKESSNKAISFPLSFLCFALLTISIVLSFFGSKQIIRNFAPEAAIERTDPEIRKQSSKLAKINNQYSIDSNLIAGNLSKLEIATNEAYKAKINIQKGKIKSLQARAASEGKSFSTSINWIRSKINKIKAEQQEKILSLNETANSRLQQISDLSRLERFKTDSLSYGRITAIEASNQAKTNAIENKILTFGFGFAWFTVFAQSCFLLICFIESKYLKLAGIQEKILLQNIDFVGNIFVLAFSAISERFKTKVANRIYTFQNLTPTLSKPLSRIEKIFNYSDLQNSFVNISSQQKEIEYLEIESEVCNYLNEASKAASENDNSKANEYNLKANEVIKTYLGNEASESEILTFRLKVIAYILDPESKNPFDESSRKNYRKLIGFNLPEQQQNSSRKTAAKEDPKNYGENYGQRLENQAITAAVQQEAAVKTAAVKTAICLNCQNAFFLNVYNKKYCNEFCKIDYHKSQNKERE